MTAQPNCEARIDREMQSTLADLRKLFTAYQEGDEDRYSDDLGNFFEYGLGFSYVAPDTFQDQPEGYFRYQISWGGPSEEFRFFVNPDLSLHRIEFWFMDWFDGASRTLSGEDDALLSDIFDFFDEVGTVRTEYDNATED